MTLPAAIRCDLNFGNAEQIVFSQIIIVWNFIVSQRAMHEGFVPS